jgi:O-antigen ligase
VRKSAVWAVMSIVIVLLSAILVGVATMRYAMAPVYPPRPEPNYLLQSLIAFGTLGCVVVGGLVVAAVASRRESGRGRVVAWGSFALVVVAAVGAFAALLSAGLTYG